MSTECTIFDQSPVWLRSLWSQVVHNIGNKESIAICTNWTDHQLQWAGEWSPHLGGSLCLRWRRQGLTGCPWWSWWRQSGPAGGALLRFDHGPLSRTPLPPLPSDTGPPYVAGPCEFWEKREETTTTKGTSWHLGYLLNKALTSSFVIEVKVKQLYLLIWSLLPYFDGGCVVRIVNLVPDMSNHVFDQLRFVDKACPVAIWHGPSLGTATVEVHSIREGCDHTGCISQGLGITSSKLHDQRTVSWWERQRALKLDLIDTKLTVSTHQWQQTPNPYSLRGI